MNPVKFHLAHHRDCYNELEISVVFLLHFRPPAVPSFTTQILTTLKNMLFHLKFSDIY
jgi:hypothetical protein